MIIFVFQRTVCTERGTCSTHCTPSELLNKLNRAKFTVKCMMSIPQRVCTVNDFNM